MPSLRFGKCDSGEIHRMKAGVTVEGTLRLTPIHLLWCVCVCMRARMLV